MIYVTIEKNPSNPYDGGNIAYLRGAAVHAQEAQSISSIEDFDTAIANRDVRGVMFAHHGYPKRVTEVDKARRLVEKLLAELALPRCPECGYRMEVVGRGATLKKHGPRYTCPLAQRAAWDAPYAEYLAAQRIVHAYPRVYAPGEAEAIKAQS